MLSWGSLSTGSLASRVGESSKSRGYLAATLVSMYSQATKLKLPVPSLLSPPFLRLLFLALIWHSVLGIMALEVGVGGLIPNPVNGNLSPLTEVPLSLLLCLHVFPISRKCLAPPHVPESCIEHCIPQCIYSPHLSVVRCVFVFCICVCLSLILKTLIRDTPFSCFQYFQFCVCVLQFPVSLVYCFPDWFVYLLLFSLFVTPPPIVFSLHVF